MSAAVRVRIGGLWHEGGWPVTGAPGTRQALHTSAVAPAWAAQQHMQTITGADWPAARPLDLRQRAVTMSFGFARDFGSPAAMATWLATALSLTPDHPWQEDVIVRWEHHDGIGYTEARLPWAGLRFDSIEHDGPSTLRVLCSIHAGEMQDNAVYAPPHMLCETGERLLTEGRVAIRLETDDYWLAFAFTAGVLAESGETLLTEEEERVVVEGPMPIYQP